MGAESFVSGATDAAMKSEADNIRWWPCSSDELAADGHLM